MNPVQPTTRTLSFTWHVADNWYGQNYRVVLLKEDSPIDFATASEAKQYRSKLARYIKAKHPEAKATTKRMVVKNYAELPTYIHSIGPSYSCSNIHITVEQLEAFITEQESSYEWRDKQRLNSVKREHRQFRKEMKAEQKRRRLEELNRAKVA